MKNIKINTKKIVATILTTSLVFSSTACSSKKNTEYIGETFQNLQQDEDLKKETTTINETEKFMEETTVINETIEYTIPENTTNLDNNKNEIIDVPKEETQGIEHEHTEPSTELQQTELENEEDVIAFFENISNKADEDTLADKFEDVKDSVTSGVATFILFMSGDSTIGGYTFESLTDAGKQKIEILFMKMDNKLENKFPGYKEIIGEKFDFVKKFIGEKYNVIKAKVKDYIVSKVGEDLYEETLNNFKSGWSDMKDSFSNTFDIIGDKAEDVKNNIVDWAKEKVKEKNK